MRRIARAFAATLALAGCAGPGETNRMDWFSRWPPDGGDDLDPKVRFALDAQGPVPDYRSEPLAPLRAHFEELSARMPKLREPLARVESLKIPGAAGNIGARLYVPEAKGPLPILLYFHGGGWVLGDLDSHDDVCRSLAKRAGILVLSVDYRRAPETKFPGPLEDCLSALRWVVQQASTLGADPARVAVGGDSAGGNLAAGLAIRVRDHGGPRISFQLLIYPVTDRDFETESYRAFATGFGLTRNNMQWFWDCYLANPGDAEDPAVSPLRAKDLSGLPPAFVVSAPCDVLRSETEAYAKRLQEAGVALRCVRYSGMNHGFIRLGALYPQADRALTDCAGALRDAWR